VYNLQERRLVFELVESRMFSSFDGAWAARHLSRRQEFDQTFKKEVCTCEVFGSNTHTRAYPVCVIF
jgi:hypothetical protein